jgi:transcription elongation factor Elf1
MPWYAHLCAKSRMKKRTSLSAILEKIDCLQGNRVVCVVATIASVELIGVVYGVRLCRCKNCGGYVNCNVSWYDEGNSWVCNLCNTKNQVEPWYAVDYGLPS